MLQWCRKIVPSMYSMLKEGNSSLPERGKVDIVVSEE
jgi:hypothetical protein